MKEHTSYIALLIVTILVVSVAGCGGNDSTTASRGQTLREQALSCSSSYEYLAPTISEYGISLGSLSGSLVDGDLLIQMLSELHCGGRDHGLNSVLIEVEGALVVEEYFPGFISATNRTILDYGTDTLHVQASVQKSFVSSLFGIAESEGYIDIQETLYEIFPDYSDINWMESYEINGVEYRKSDITVEDLLLMAAGFEWNEGAVYYGHPDNPLTQMNASEDPTRFILELPLVYAPGDFFQYNTGLSDILKIILEKKTGLSVVEYAERSLFQALSIQDFFWQNYLSVRPRDMLKLGKMYLNDGNFEGVQVLPEAWVDRSLAGTLSFGSGERIAGYGYQWWVSEFTIDNRIYSANAALGYGGQQIYVFDEFDAVVVFTAAEYPGHHGDTFTTFSWLEDYIVPSLIEGSQP